MKKNVSELISVEQIASLRLRDFVKGMRESQKVLWFLCLYILFEYIRPQGMYRSLDFLPWGEVSILLCLISMLVSGSKSVAFNAMDKVFVLTVISIFMSIVLARDPSKSLEHWTTILSWILMYFFIVSIITTPKRLILFVIFFLIINFKMSQHGSRTFAMRGFSFASYGLSGAPGWFHNSGELALQMAVVFSMSLALLVGLKKYVANIYRWWFLVALFPFTAALTNIGSSSRGGQLALAVVFILFNIKNRKFIRNLIVLCMVGWVAYSFLPDTQKARFETAGEDKTSQLRLMHWKYARETISEHPFGIGYKNWPSYYEETYRPDLVEMIHNTSLEAYVDLGVIGGTLFHIMLILMLLMNYSTIREMRHCSTVESDIVSSISTGLNLALIGTFIAAFFMSVLWYPMFWFGFAMTSAIKNISRTVERAPVRLARRT